MMITNIRNFVATGGTDRSTYLDAMSRAATGVNVVTTDGPAGRAGLTLSAMTSVSVDGPAPQLLVCINRDSAAGQVVLRNGLFVVNVLRDDQAHLSDVFAGRTSLGGSDRFVSADWTSMTTGAPRLIDPLAAFDCRITDVRGVDSHNIVLGTVVDVFQADRGTALVYADRGYKSLIPLAAPSAAAA